MTRVADRMFTARLQQGLTLVELVVVIAILSVALIGVAAAITAAISRTSDVMVETRAVALAQSYLDEILGKRFDEHSAPRGIPPCRSNCTEAASFGLDGSESGRADYDDVDDYHGLNEGEAPLNPLRDSEGMPRSGYDGFVVNVAVRYLEPCGREELLLNLPTEFCYPADETEALAAIPVVESNARRAKVITVTVYPGLNSAGWPFSVYKFNF